jgi:GntR family transcriptional regulator
VANPMYRQIAEDLRVQIESGGLEPGQKLRTEIELREHYSASRNTVRDAIKWLTALGLVETKPGQGTFVVQKIEPFITTLSSSPGGLGGGEGASYLSEVSARDRTPQYSAVHVEIREAFPDLSAALRIREGAEVISRHERRYIDGVPWSLQTSYYPMEFAERGAEQLMGSRNIEEGTVRYLADTLQMRQAGYSDHIAVRAPGPTEADFFKLPQDGRTVVYEIQRTAFAQTGQPMRLTVTVYPADRNQFIFNSGEVPQHRFQLDP